MLFCFVAVGLARYWQRRNLMAARWIIMEFPGLVTDGHTFKDAIESFQQSESHASHGSGGNSGDAAEQRPRNVVITRTRDKFSPVFFNSLTNDNGFAEMTISVLTFEDGSMASRVFYNLSDVLLESYAPLATVSLKNQLSR